MLANYNAWREGVSGNVSFRMKNFWDENLSSYDVVSIFGVAPIMPLVMKKVEQEARTNTHIVSFRFPIKHVTPAWRDGELYIYSYSPHQSD